MRSGITRQALRRHRWALAGPGCTQTLGAAVIAVMLMTAASLRAPGLSAVQRQAIAAGQVADTAAVFLGVAIYLSVLVVGVTMNLAVSRQVRDLALLRTIGATPGQIRRSVVLQAAVVSVPASLLGCLLALPLGVGWLALLRDHGVLPAGVGFTPTLTALPAAMGIQLATSVAGAWTGGRRTARLAPAIALTESTSGRRRLGRPRILLGLLLLAGGLVGSAAVSTLAADQADDAAFFVLLAECIGTGLVGPVVLRAVAGGLRPVFADGLPRLALDGVASLSRPLSGALVPLVLALAFAAIKVAAHTTAAAVTGRPDPAADVWTDYCGTAVYCAFAGIAALNALVTVLVGRRGDLAVLQLAGGSRRRVVLLVAGEAAVVTAAAVLLAGVAAGATLLPMLHTSLGTWLPRVPVPALGAGLLLTAGLVAAGMVLPAAVLTRQPPLERSGGDRVSAVRAVLRAPVSGRTWRELAHLAVRVLLGLPAFLLALLGLVAAPLSLLGIGLPLLAGTLLLARRAPLVFRAPARRLLGWDWAAPPPLPARRLTTLLRDETAWRALLYCFVVFPLALTGTYLAAVAVVAGTAAVTSPAWSLMVPDGWWESWTGDSWADSWGLAVQGAAVLLVFPWLVHGLVLLDRVLAGGLLAPDRAGQRIAELESSRAVVSADAAATLRRLERDLHDGTQARLVTIGLLLSRLEHREADPGRRAELASARTVVSDGLVELREIIRGMHPPALDDGLPTALATLAARSAVPTEFRDELRSRPADAVAGTLYFTAAELLTNVARHARATSACLHLAETGDRIVLAVSDDGRGGAQLGAGGSGLAGLRRRAEALDGSLTIDSRDGGPTTVTVTLPRG